MEPLPNLLIVDDYELNLDFLEAILRNTKVNLIRASSGAEALEKTHGMELALAVLDVRMPVMDGFELATRLNENRSGGKLPVIFITASQFGEVETHRGYECGAVDYLYKPIKSYILLSKVNVFLDLFNQRQTIARDAALLRQSADVLGRANAVIKKAEEKYRNYISNAPDGVFVADEKGRYVEVNEAASNITGYSAGELLNMSISDILPEGSLKDAISDFGGRFTNGRLKVDQKFKHKDGTLRWWTIEAVKLSETRFIGFTKDITDRKKTGEELQESLEQLHKLTQYIEKVREEERLAISHELHDDLGQALTAVKIDLGIIEHAVSDQDTLLRITKVKALVSDTIKTVQRITSQLRPQIIDDLGLEAAIEWYTNEFIERNKIGVYFEMDSGVDLSPDASLVIFRIMQESLTNIARHAEASRVDISLRKNGESMTLRICDDGIGISENEVRDKKSFGIISMQERTAFLGGTFEIGQGKNGGTEIKLTLPLNHQKTDENIDLR